MSRRFLPVREAEFDAWLANFSDLIAAAPATYGLTAGDAAALSAAVAAWHAAYVIAFSPATRTVATVADKRNAKARVTAVTRSLAARVRSNGAVAPELKVNLGLVLRSVTGSPVSAPQSVPRLSMRAMDARLHILRATDSVSERAGKPERVAGLVVFRAVADGPMASAEVTGDGQNERQGPAYLGLFTRGRIVSEFTAADRGKTATYFARWVNAKGQPGPWSQGLSVPIAA